MTPDKDKSQVEMVQRLVRRRARMAVEFGVVPLSDLVTLHGADEVGEWRRQHRLLVLQHSGGEVCPRFALDAQGRPKPVIADLLDILGAEHEPWKVALWVTAAHGKLADQARPVDLLDADPSAVLEAARHEVAGAGD